MTIFCASAASTARADDVAIAKELANPVSDLISVPFQFNHDQGYGPSQGARFTLNIQPVIPFQVSPDWNVIIRTILPVINQLQTAPGTGSHFGLGDTTQSIFFSPRNLDDDMIFGIGPVFMWPTGSDPALRAEKWGAGPTVVVVHQTHGWTYGMLTNHIWSYAGSSTSRDVSATFVQPFIFYTFPNTTTLSLNAESTYDWIAKQWTVPINAGISKIFKFGAQPVSLGVQGRYFAERPVDGPKWGARFTATLLFPK